MPATVREQNRNKKLMSLKKTIYGLVQAPLSYFKLCKEVYAKVGLRQLDCDECVFVKFSQNIKGQPLCLLRI